MCTYWEYDMNICLTMRNIWRILHITNILTCYVMMYWWQLSFRSDVSYKFYQYSLPHCSHLSSSPIYLAMLMTCRIFQLCSKNEHNSAPCNEKEKKYQNYSCITSLVQCWVRTRRMLLTPAFLSVSCYCLGTEFASLPLYDQQTTDGVLLSHYTL